MQRCINEMRASSSGLEQMLSAAAFKSDHSSSSKGISIFIPYSTDYYSVTLSHKEVKKENYSRVFRRPWLVSVSVKRVALTSEFGEVWYFPRFYLIKKIGSRFVSHTRLL